jgi:hypothetical protein
MPPSLIDMSARERSAYVEGYAHRTSLSKMLGISPDEVLERLGIDERDLGNKNADLQFCSVFVMSAQQGASFAVDGSFADAYQYIDAAQFFGRIALDQARRVLHAAGDADRANLALGYLHANRTNGWFFLHRGFPTKAADLACAALEPRADMDPKTGWSPYTRQVVARALLDLDLHE